MVRQRNATAHLIFDPSWFRSDLGSEGKGLPPIMKKEITDQLENIGRTFCFQLYKRRFEMYSNDDETDSESEEDEGEFSLHDTTEDSIPSETDSDSDTF